jgi:hypothetical protein
MHCNNQGGGRVYITLTWSEVEWFGSNLQEWLCWFSEGEGRAIITLTGPEGKWFAVGLGMNTTAELTIKFVC